MEIIGVIVGLFFVGIIFRTLFPKTYERIGAAIDRWGEKGIKERD